VVLCLSFTACNKAETSSSENKSVTNQKNDDSKSKEDNINENKSKDEKKADKKEIEKVDDAVLKFTSRYVEVFGKDGDACFDIKFIKDDFIPSDVKGKINVLKTDSSAEKDSSSENNENPKDVMYKHLIINFHDGALYRVSTMEDNANDIKTVKNVYLAKGDAFILDCTNQQYTIDIFSADEMEGHSIIWASDIDFEGSAKKKYSIYRWETQRKASDFTACEELINKVLEDFGAIDILVNNAGITKDNLLMRMSEVDFDKVIAVNLKSIFNMTKAVQKVFLKQRNGNIINMSSVVGVQGNAGQANYAASKAGILGFTKSVALELGSRNIRCNAIAPGFIETEMTAKLAPEVVQGWRDAIPLKRGGTVEDIANACVFLASQMSSYITGQVLRIDGGMITA